MSSSEEETLDGDAKGSKKSNVEVARKKILFPMGTFEQLNEQKIICKAFVPKAPPLNAPVYFENRTQLGIIEDILGSANDFHISIKLNESVLENKFENEQWIFIDTTDIPSIRKILCRKSRSARKKKKSKMVKQGRKRSRKAGKRRKNNAKKLKSMKK